MHDGGPGPQAPGDQIINTSFGPWAQAQGGHRAGVISINTSFGTWAQAHWDPRTGVIYFLFLFLDHR